MIVKQPDLTLILFHILQLSHSATLDRPPASPHPRAFSKNSKVVSSEICFNQKHSFSIIIVFIIIILCVEVEVEVEVEA